MNYFLAKTEPASYSIDQLRQDMRTTWDGIRNPQALKAVRSMRPGDRVFIYHSGSQAAVVGLAEVVSDARSVRNEPNLAEIDVGYLTHLDPPTKLAEIKGSGLFADWALVRQGRLSTMEVPDSFVTWVRKRYPGIKI